MKIGLISDTHGFLDPQLPKIFRGVDHILHAGDIGPDRLLAQLESIAPVTAVLGNNDSSNWIALTETPTLGGRKFLIHHIVSPHALTSELESQIKRTSPHIVVFGHTHRRFDETINGVWFINPGYSGQPKPDAASVVGQASRLSSGAWQSNAQPDRRDARPTQSGQPKQGAERSVAILHLEKTPRLEFISL